MMVDLHTHSKYSFDADYSVNEMLAGAKRAGIDELCITDHVDFDAPGKEVGLPDFMARHKAARESNQRGVRLTLGAEVSLQNDASARASWEYIRNTEMDYIIGSVHMIGEENVWADAFYENRTREQAYKDYLSAVARMLPTFPELDVLGHYDFVAKYAPYDQRAVKYSDAPKLFDEIFTCLLDQHQSLEINTSAWRNDKPWGIDIIKRFVKLGGRYVTIGSDAHNPSDVGNRVKEAMALAREAGVQNIAIFSDRKPQFIRL